MQSNSVYYSHYLKSFHLWKLNRLYGVIDLQHSLILNRHVVTVERKNFPLTGTPSEKRTTLHQIFLLAKQNKPTQLKQGLILRIHVVTMGRKNFPLTRRFSQKEKLPYNGKTSQIKLTLPQIFWLESKLKQCLILWINMASVQRKPITCQTSID